MSQLSLTKTPAATVTAPEDVTVAAAWGYTATEWQTLTDHARADFRRRVVFAPYFRAVTA